MSVMLNFILEKIRICIRENIEYKANLWTAILANVATLVVYNLFFFVYSDLTSQLINWNKYDFLLYSFLSLAAAKAPLLASVLHFNHFLLSGGLNSILCKPINPFLFSSLKSLHGPIIFMFPTLILVIVCLLVYNSNFSSLMYNNYILAIFTFFFGMSLQVLVFSALNSLAFFIKSNSFMVRIYAQVNQTNRSFTPKMLDNLSFWFYLLPSSISGYIVIEILLGRVQLFYDIFAYIIALFCVLVIVLYLLWHYGLRRYEAFG